jgi:pSer/pThr/pTyr-binding forkhead associated (FHA) protein
MLKLQIKDNSQRDPIWIVDPILSIGKNNTNDVVIKNDAVKEFHAQIILRGEKVFLKDITGNNGCYVNERKIEEVELKAGDIIKLNSVEMEVLDGKHLAKGKSKSKSSENGWSLISNNSWLEGQAFQLSGKCIIGRGMNCDITIPGTHLSRQHCEITVKGTRLHVKDLGSSNGTFINEKKVVEGEAKPGDVLRVDVYSFEILGPEGDSDRTMVRSMQAPSSRKEQKPSAQTNADNKEWKTKPNSPGNREEFSASSGGNLLVYGFLILGIAAVIGYMFLS